MRTALAILALLALAGCAGPPAPTAHSLAGNGPIGASDSYVPAPK